MWAGIRLSWICLKSALSSATQQVIWAQGHWHCNCERRHIAGSITCRRPSNCSNQSLRKPITVKYLAEGMWRSRIELDTLLATGVMWKGFETYSQISLRNIFLVGSDWVRTKLFGRDISKV